MRFIQSLNKRKKELECQLDHLDKFVTDLRSHKISLENVNQQLEQLASRESDASKRAKYYVAIRSNIELLTKYLIQYLNLKVLNTDIIKKLMI